MKTLTGLRQHRQFFPYVVTTYGNGYVRNRMDLYDATRPDSTTRGFDPVAIGYAGPGRQSVTTRERLVQFFALRARRSATAYCIVFDEGDCVHVLSDGTTLNGHTPPVSDTQDVRDYDEIGYPLVDLHYVALPVGSNASHLCIQTLGSDRYEVSSGAPCILGSLNEADENGRTLAARHTDASGRFQAPSRFRGALVTGVMADEILLGPVQPDGDVRIVVGPWPSEVKAACLKIAGRKIPAVLFETVWRVIDPQDRGMNWVGVLEAA